MNCLISKGQMQKLAIIALLAFAVVFLGGCGASQKQNYDDGVSALHDGNYQKASELFEKAGDYEDAKEYKACSDLAYAVYENGTSEEIEEALNKVDTSSEALAAVSEDCKQVLCFVLGDGAITKGYYSQAQSLFEMLPTDYEFVGMSAFDRASVAAISGEWLMTQVENNETGDTLDMPEDDTVHLTCNPDGTWSIPQFQSEGTWTLDDSSKDIDGYFYGLYVDKETLFATFIRLGDSAVLTSDGNTFYSFERA